MRANNVSVKKEGDLWRTICDCPKCGHTNFHGGGKGEIPDLGSRLCHNKCGYNYDIILGKHVTVKLEGRVGSGKTTLRGIFQQAWVEYLDKHPELDHPSVQFKEVQTDE